MDKNRIIIIDVFILIASVAGIFFRNFIFTNMVSLALIASIFYGYYQTKRKIYLWLGMVVTVIATLQVVVQLLS
jgi:hypothetical protein